MKPITIHEILSFSDYERVRPRLRPLFIAEKERRRLAVGEHLTLLFENGQTVWYQIQEMVRVEGIMAEAAIQHEIDTYNELIPPRGELAATLLIEYAKPAERDVALRKLVGLERHVWFVLDEQRHGVRFDPRQISSERISAVQFVRLPLGGLGSEEFARLAEAHKIAVEIDHPNLSARAVIGPILASALTEDLRPE